MSCAPRRYPVAVVVLTSVLVAAPSYVLSSLAAVSARVSRPLPQGTAADTSASVLDGVFTSAQASRGQAQFVQTCMTCHTVAQHTGRAFAVKWAGTTLDELFELISTTMPEIEPGSLKPEQYTSIVAFFLKESGYPEGQRELPSDAAALKKIRVEPLAK